MHDRLQQVVVGQAALQEDLGVLVEIFAVPDGRDRQRRRRPVDGVVQQLDGHVILVQEGHDAVALRHAGDAGLDRLDARIVAAALFAGSADELLNSSFNRGFHNQIFLLEALYQGKAGRKGFSG